MTSSRYYKVLMASALVCALPVSEACSGPLGRKMYDLWAACCGSEKPQYKHPYGKFSDQRSAWFCQDSSPQDTFSQTVPESSDIASSGLFSTKNILIGGVLAAVAVAGYTLWDWYASSKKREEDRKRQEAFEAAEQARKKKEREAASQEVEGLWKMASELKRKRSEHKKVAFEAAEQACKREADKAREKVTSLFADLNRAAEAAAAEEAFETTFAELGNLTHAFDEEDQGYCDVGLLLSDQVKNCSLCNALTVSYLNALYEDKDTEHKEKVIAFLTNLDSSLWDNREIMPLINKEDPSFVIDRLEYIAKGEQYVASLLAGKHDMVPQSNQQEYLDSLISITWYFYAKALKKGDGFSASGSFNIQSKALMEFFEGYYHKVRKWHGEFCETATAWVAEYTKCGTNKLGDHPFAYERCSSHLRGFDATNYGIDIRFVSDAQGTSWFSSISGWLGKAVQSMFDFFDQVSAKIKRTLHEYGEANPEGVAKLQQMDCALPKMKTHLEENDALQRQLSQVDSVQTLLPDGKAHLLFIPYDAENGRFLLKPERHGTTIFDLADAVAHAREFLHGSKDDDYKHTRREKMKKDAKFKKLQEQYAQHAPGQGFHKRRAENKARVRKSTDDTQEIARLGCQYMLKQLNHWLAKSNLGKYTREQLTQLRQELIELYLDHHDIRFAHEVVFKKADFA